MVTSYETISHSSLTGRFSALAEKNRHQYTPISPDKHIKPEENIYTVAELLELNEQDLRASGVTEEELLFWIDDGIEQITVVEKNNNLEISLGWAQTYWKSLDKSLEKKLSAAGSSSDAYYTDVRTRAMGINRFLDTAKEVTNPEAFEVLHNIVTTACDIYIIAEANAGHLSLDNNLKASAISRAVSLGLSNPELLDAAIKMTTGSVPEGSTLRDELEAISDGIKAEFIAGQIIGSYAYPDIGYDIVFQKPAPFRDVMEGADFTLTISERRFSKELAVFDVKKAAIISEDMCCRVVVENAVPEIYTGEHTAGHLEDLFGIEPNFLASVVRKNEVGVVIRLPRKLVSKFTIAQLAKMNNGSEVPEGDSKPVQAYNSATEATFDDPVEYNLALSEYNSAKAQVHRELSYVIERVGQ